MDKLNITEGEWKLTDNFEITVGDVDPQEMSSEEIEANAKAIVTAVNNTYKKGINPEAVPDMLEALKVLVDRIEYYSSFEEPEVNIEDWAYTEGSGDFKKVKQALKKAEL